MPATDYILVVAPDEPAPPLDVLIELHGLRAIRVADLPTALRVVRTIIPALVMIDDALGTFEELLTLAGAVRATGPFVPVLLVGSDLGRLPRLERRTAFDGFINRRARPTEIITHARLGLELGSSRRARDEERIRMRLLVDVAKILHRSLDLDTLLQELLATISDTLGASQASVILLDADGQPWRQILLREHLSPAAAEDAVRHALRVGLAGHALRAQTIQIVSDARSDGRWIAFENDAPVGSALAIPLFDHRTSHALGVLILVHPTPNTFTTALLPLAQALAEQINVAITNATLYTRLREAEANRALLIQMLTHDLRTPLAGMIGCFDALLTTPLDENGTLFVDMGLQAGAAQQRLIDDLLDLYKADAGHLALILAPTALATLGAALSAHMAASALDANLRLTINLPPAPEVLLDSHKMVRVLANLVGNSIKWTPPGGTITVSGAVHAETICIEVADTGIGIDPADRERIFERFFQGRRHAQSRGSGLGLAFCDLVVSAHQGSITAISEAPAGTTMRILIPRNAQEVS